MTDEYRWNQQGIPALLLLGLLAALVLWAPLPFGSVLPWSHTVLEITAGILLTLVLLDATRAAGLRPALLPAACLAGVALLGALQASAWPPGIVRKVSPEHSRLQAAARSELREAGAATEVPDTLTLAPAASRSAALTFAAVVACLLAGAAVYERTQRRVLALAILASGIFQVLLGARALANHEGTIWGEAVGGDPVRLRGTFVNPDHLALYLELVLTVAFAWGWWALRRAREEMSVERKIALVAGPTLAWLTLFVGLAFTGSRAGVVAAVTGTVAQGVFLALGRRRVRLGASGILLVLVGTGTVAAVGLQQGFGRWLATSQHELAWNDRLRVYASSWDLWQRFPVTGTGLASFRDAFSLVAPRDLPGLWYWHAHNDYLEILVTTGLVGGVLLAVAVAALVVRLARVLRDGERSEDRCAALAALGAIAAFAVHSAFDFGLSMPANAATLAIVCGTALVARKDLRQQR